MRIIAFIVLFVVAQNNLLDSQEKLDLSHTDYYEVKTGKVANGHGMTIGIAGKFYGTNYFNTNHRFRF
jgi:hypothetical protein